MFKIGVENDYFELQNNYFDLLEESFNHGISDEEEEKK